MEAKSFILSSSGKALVFLKGKYKRFLMKIGLQNLVKIGEDKENT